MVATEPVELQVRVEDEVPEVNTRGFMMLGIAAGRDRQRSVADFESKVCQKHDTIINLVDCQRRKGMLIVKRN